MVAIEFALAKHSSDATSLRSKEAAKSKILTEKQPPKKPILGYKGAGKKGKRRWILDKKTAPLVRKVFEEFAAGKYTLEKIADYAYTIGLRSIAPNNKSGRIHKNTISNRLRDIQYTGIIIYDGEKYPGAYLPLIPTELFYKVQRVFEKKNIQNQLTENMLIQDLSSAKTAENLCQALTKKATPITDVARKKSRAGGCTRCPTLMKKF